MHAQTQRRFRFPRWIGQQTADFLGAAHPDFDEQRFLAFGCCAQNPPGRAGDMLGFDRCKRGIETFRLIIETALGCFAELDL
ncbi:MAG: hypothetical protein ACREP1_14350, partial [Rhodanobacteraceae bacterium]